MSMNAITVDAVFENGVLRPLTPLPLAAQQRVTLIVQVPEEATAWPEDVAGIYQEIAEEDRRLARAMWSTVQKTWPTEREQS
jgi:predicted DNA-binding antitoxin AbrB/MazE fold protein